MIEGQTTRSLENAEPVKHLPHLDANSPEIERKVCFEALRHATD